MAGQDANTLATVEYRFDDEGFAIRFEDVPMRYDAQTGREYIHVRISKPLHKKVRELAETMRQRGTYNSASSGFPRAVTVNASELLSAA